MIHSTNSVDRLAAHGVNDQALSPFHIANSKPTIARLVEREKLNASKSNPDSREEAFLCKGQEINPCDLGTGCGSHIKKPEKSFMT